MTLRTATPDDLPAIAALHAANWRQHYAELLPAGVLGDRLDTYMAERWGIDALARAVVLVAEDGAGPLGFVACVTGGAEGVLIDNLHVARAARGNGTGRALAAAAGHLAGARPVWLEVLEGNTVARAIYRDWGGVEGPVFDDMILGARVPARRVDWACGDALARRLLAREPAG